MSLNEEERKIIVALSAPILFYYYLSVAFH